jgi:ABC-2 type transport system permease protein
MKLLLQIEGKLLLNHVKSSKKQAYATIGFSTLFIALIIIFSVGIAFLMLKLSTIRLKKGIRVAKVQSRSNLGRQS